MTRFRIGSLVTLLVVVACSGFWSFLKWQSDSARLVAPLPSLCVVAAFEGTNYVVCTVDPAKARTSLHLKDANGKPWRQIERFTAAMRDGGHPIAFAMNAGMYHEDLSPVGLYVENGSELAPLQTGQGKGNFYLRPNGVFGIMPDGKPFIKTAEVFTLSKLPTKFATQSGPMLAIDGIIHPRFEPDGTSRFIRNGVGLDVKGRAVFVISRTPVSFGSFARLFKDKLECPNALYFDGVVSALSNGESIVIGGQYPAGPIVAVSELSSDVQ
jgi:uncharacterized protein YigE (DUF2233 family)